YNGRIRGSPKLADRGHKEEIEVKINKKILGGVAALSAASLVLAGCASSDGETTPKADGTDTPAESTGEAITVANGSEPQNALIPTNTNEVGGGKILDSILAGLVYYDAEGTAHNDVAESIEQVDPTKYAITLEEGWTFTNGDPVTAHSFVDAWNFGAQL